MIKVSELTGAQLDYWVARAEGDSIRATMNTETGEIGHYVGPNRYVPYRPSIDWAQGGPLIEKYKLSPYVLSDNRWALSDHKGFVAGSTPLQAICRAVVRAAFGDEVEEGV